MFFNRNASPLPSGKVAGGNAPIAGQGARVAACPPDAASVFNQGTCSTKSGAPILVGLDSDALMKQQYNIGAFGELTFDGNADANGVPAGTTDIAAAAGTYMLAFTFSAACCWQAAGIYFSQSFVDSLVAPAGVVANAAYLVGVYPATAWNQNIAGYGQGNSNRIPLGMLTDPRQNCCPLIDYGPVAAGSPYVVQIELVKTTLAAIKKPILVSMFGETK